MQRAAAGAAPVQPWPRQSTHQHTINAHTQVLACVGMCANLNKESNEEQQRRVARRVISQAAKVNAAVAVSAVWCSCSVTAGAAAVYCFCFRCRCLGLQRVGGTTVTAGGALSIRTRS